MQTVGLAFTGQRQSSLPAQKLCVIVSFGGLQLRCLLSLISWHILSGMSFVTHISSLCTERLQELPEAARRDAEPTDAGMQAIVYGP